MVRAWLLLAALSMGFARGAAPTYSAESIVNGANFAPGPLAPNAIATLFGSDLAYGTAGFTPADTLAGALPSQLSDVRVYVANMPAPLLYVSPTQINFLVPGNLKPGAVPVRVVRQGLTGPEAVINLADAAPQFFATQEGYVIAQHGKDYSLITVDSPAAAGEIVVIYATGLGRTQPNPNPGEIPAYPGRMSGELTLWLGGSAVPSERIFYAGLTPGSAGVYQINFSLPENAGRDPEIRAAAAGQTSAVHVKLATQLSSGAAR